MNEWLLSIIERNTEVVKQFGSELVKEAEKKTEERKSKSNVNAKRNPLPDNKDRKYAMSALRNEVEKLSKTPEGERNKQYNESTFRVAQLAAGCGLDQMTVEEAVKEMAREIGMDEGEIAGTFRSAYQAGIKHPRARPASRQEKSVEQVFGSENKSEGKAHRKELPETINFPLDVFTSYLQRFVKEGATSCRCPVDFFAMPMITAAASMIGGSRCLMVKEDWHVQPNLYVAIVADPGAAKSPALSKVMAPIKRRHRLNMEAFKQAKKIHKENPEPSEVPTLERTYTTDATGEKLAGILQECPRGIILYKDELTAWIRGMDQYKSGGKGTERQMYLSCWSNEAFSVERKSNEDGVPVSVQRPVLSVLGGIQPDMLPLLADSKGRADGFIDRILFCYPRRGKRPPWTWEGISPQTRQAWQDTIDNLWALKIEYTPEDGIHPRVVEMNAEAKVIWEKWQSEHEAEMEADGFEPVLRGAWAKMDSQLARIALTLHLMWLASEDNLRPFDIPELTASSIKSATMVIDYLKTHIRRSLVLLEVEQEERQVQKAAGWIERHGGNCTMRDLYSNRVAGIKKSSEAEKMFDLLKDYGFGETSNVKGENDRNVVTFTIRRQTA